MEALASAGGVFAIVSLAGQVAQGCAYLRGIFNDATNAPQELRLLTAEIAIIERIVSFTRPDQLSNTIQDDSEYQDALDFAGDAIARLQKVVDKYGELDDAGKYRKWGRRLAWALSVDKVAKHLHRFKDAKDHLQHYHDRSTNGQFLQSFQQLRASQAEITTILSGTAGRVEELNHTSKETQAKLQELASRVVYRDDRSVTQITNAVENTLRGLFEDYLSEIARESASNSSGSIPIQMQSPRYSRLSGEKRISYLSDSPHISATPKCVVPGIQQRLADLAHGRFDEETSHLPQEEIAAQYRTWLGEVYLQTVSTTYHTANGMEKFSLPSCFESLPCGLQFPVTVSKTEILLLPRSWELSRGSTVLCQHISGPGVSMADIVIRLKHFRNLQSASPSPKLSGVKRETPGPIGQGEQPRSSDTEVGKSSSLLYTAFKSAFAATHSRVSTFQKAKLNALARSTLRRSVDNEVNDALELVHLWINSGLDGTFYKEAFPTHIAESRARSETMAVCKRETRSIRDFQTVRHQYMFQLVTEMVKGSELERDSPHTSHNLGFRLDIIHQEFTDLWQSIACAASLYSNLFIRSGLIEYEVVLFPEYVHSHLRITTIQISLPSPMNFSGNPAIIVDVINWDNFRLLSLFMKRFEEEFYEFIALATRVFLNPLGILCNPELDHKGTCGLDADCMFTRIYDLILYHSEMLKLSNRPGFIDFATLAKEIDLHDIKANNSGRLVSKFLLSFSPPRVMATSG